jgi:nicotinamidase-related amidase
MKQIKYKKNNTGLVLVDPYNDVLSEGGKAWPRLKEMAESVGLHQHLRQLLNAVRNAEIQVFVAPHHRWRPGDFEGWLHPARAHRLSQEQQLFAAGTFGGEWHPEFGPKEGDIVCYEHWGMGGFPNTDLDLHLRQHGIEQIILVGMTAPGCVEATGRQGMELGYSITLVKDATAAYTQELLHASHELTGPLYAESIVTTEEVIAALP